VALVKKATGYGKNLYIWDCDANMTFDSTNVPPREIMSSTQMKLVKLAKDKGRIEGVWYGGSGSGQDRKVELTAAWIYRLAQLEDTTFDEKDPRFIGFKRFEKN